MNTEQRKVVFRFLKHPLFITVVTFIFTGILASTYQNYLVDRIKKQEIETSDRQKNKRLRLPADKKRRNLLRR
jgi:hypothetical protein